MPFEARLYIQGVGVYVPDEEAPEPKDLLTEVAELLEQVLSQVKKARSAANYLELLKKSKGNAADPLVGVDPLARRSGGCDC